MMAIARKLILGLAAMLLLGAGPGLADETRVIFVTHGQAADPYWRIIMNGMNDAADKLGVKVEYHAPARFSIAEMQRLIADAIAAKPDGLVVSSPDAVALTPSMEAATAAGIPLIIIDSGGPTLAKNVGALFFMGQSEFGAGIEAGRRASVLGVKKALCINH